LPYDPFRMSWHVCFHKKAAKQLEAIPESIAQRLDALVQEIAVAGPLRGNWKNYGKLSATQHHCHIKSGKPTYVVCWEVKDKTIKIVEVYYVGTHEKAPY